VRINRVQPSIAIIASAWVAALVGCADAPPYQIDETALRARIEQQQRSDPPSLEPLPDAADRATLTRGAGEYRLGVADVVRISVLNNSRLDTEQAIRPDGRIAVYPVGDIVAAGLTVDELRRAIIERLRANTERPYRIGVQDVISITVYEHEKLDVTQSVGPDGTISVLPGGEIEAAGLTLKQLRARVAERISRLVRDPLLNIVITEYGSQPLLIVDPIVNVVVTEFNSRRVSILGAVDTPGILKLRSDVTLVEAISQAGGLSADADLQKSMLFRGQELLPVSFERLFRQGDMSQNVTLEPNDAIFVASTRFNKIYVIGEVRNPGTITWEGSLNLVEAVTTAGGFTEDASPSRVLVIKDGLVEPTLHLVDAGRILGEGAIENNMDLESGDIVFVPVSDFATAERYLDAALKVLRPVLALESAIILGDSARKVLQGEGQTTGTSINLNP